MRSTRPNKPAVRLNCETLEDRVNPVIAYALTGAGPGIGNLLAFDTASPAITQTVGINGIAAGIGAETLVGIDFRPQNGLLYGLGVTPAGAGTLYVISPRTGQATAVGAAGSVTPAAAMPDPTMATSGFGFDFNPLADRIRVVTSSGQSFVINPNDGLVTTNNASVTGRIPTGTAYTNNTQNAAFTTLYTIDSTSDSLYLQDPATSATTLVAAIGAGDFTAVNGFDIPVGVNVTASNMAAPAGSAGFAALTVGGVSRLYALNLTTGATTSLGTIGGGTAAISGLAVQNDYGGFPAVAITGATVGTADLIRFNTSAPGMTSTPVPVITAGETLVGVDYRPATGQLYGLGVSAAGAGTLYRIDPQTGAVAVVGTVTPAAAMPDPALATSGFGFDFNPTVDRIRVVTSSGQSFVIDPNTGTVTTNNATIMGATTSADAAAYTNSFGQPIGVGGLTSLYVLNSATDALYLQNAGTSATTLVAPITLAGGGALNFTRVDGFDIPARVRATANNTVVAGFGYATLTVGAATNLYRIDLTTGVATSLGATAAGTSGLALADAPAGAAAFTATSVTVGEGGTFAVINLTRTGGTSGPLNVTVTATGGTAAEGADFVAGPYGVTFADGATTASLSIPIIDDRLVESPETIVLAITAVSGGAAMGATTTTTVNIVDNDTIQPIVIAAGQGIGGGAVNLYDSVGAVIRTFTPYAGYTGGVNVAVGDVTGDGADDVVTGTATGTTHVKVFDGLTGAEVRSFIAYVGAAQGIGVNVGVGDINGDGRLDILTGATTNGHVKVFSGTNNAELRSFLAYVGANASVAVTVASGDVDGDGRDDIITGASVNGHVKAFSGVSGAELRSFLAYTGFTGSVFVGSGDINGDGRDDIITGAGPGTVGGHVKAFSGVNNAEIRSFLAYPGFLGGVSVTAGDANGDGILDIITGAVAAAPGHVKAFSGTDLALLRSFFAFSSPFSGGVFVG